MNKVDIIVPHFGDVLPLKEALNALTKSTSINYINKLVVVENGPLSGAEEVCKEISNVAVKYIYASEPGLCNARNLGITNSDADFLIFFDNDLGFASCTLESYYRAFSEYGENCFYGGPVEPVYETPPPEWKLSFVPPSVKGFYKGDKNYKSDSADFLGGNHALSRKSIGELNKHFGTVYEGESATGKDGGGVGEEHRLQKRLIELGFQSCYVAGAKVFHPVPTECLSHQWICNRRFRRGITDASKHEMFKSRFLIRNTPAWVYIRFVKSAILENLSLAFNPRIALKYGVIRAWCGGVISGRKAGI